MGLRDVEALRQGDCNNAGNRLTRLPNACARKREGLAGHIHACETDWTARKIASLWRVHSHPFSLKRDLK